MARNEHSETSFPSPHVLPEGKGADSAGSRKAAPGSVTGHPARSTVARREARTGEARGEGGTERGRDGSGKG